MRREMTYVLILAPRVDNRWPAVIPGYATREEAEAAGAEVIMVNMIEEEFEADNWGMKDWLKWKLWVNCPWSYFMVIAG